MIFVDSNIPMYLIGAEHPNRSTARRVLERLVAAGEVLATSAEVFQEILHRYVALQRPDAIGPAFDALAGVVDHVFSVELADVERARELLGRYQALSARDALHAAVMERHRVETILTFDAGFDQVDWIDRLAD